MKILVINHYKRLSPRVKLEVMTLLNSGHSVKIFNWVRDGNSSKERKLNIEDIELNAPKGSPVLIFYLPFFFWKLIQKLLKEEAEVIHCTHLFLLPFCIYWRKRKRAKVVYDVYEMYAIGLSEYISPLKKWIRKAVEFLENRLIAKVDYVLTIDSINDFLKKRYCQFNENVEILYNVPKLNISLSSKIIEDLKRKYEEKRVIVYTGGIKKKKGLMKSLDAIRLVKEKVFNIKLLFIGSLQGSGKEVHEYIIRYGLENNIEFIDWLPYEEMLCYLKIAEIGLALHQPVDLYKLVSTGNGRKFFTYMQASLPIVGPELGEVGQVVREEGCGILIDSTNPEQIAEAIVYLLEHPQEAKSMGKRGRKAIEEKYNWEIEKKKLLKAYQKLEDKISE